MEEDPRFVTRMESSMEISTDGSIMKMSTSESELSISEKCQARLSSESRNHSDFILEDVSDKDIISEVRSENGSVKYGLISNCDVDYSDLQSQNGSLGSIEAFLADSESHNVSFEKSNYFSLTFNDEDNRNLSKPNFDEETCHDASKKGTFLKLTPKKNLDEDYSDREEDETLVCDISNLSLKKSSLKLFSPEKVVSAMTGRCPDDWEVKEVVSPMDTVSSPENENRSHGVSEDSNTCVFFPDGGNEDDSLDEVSSGEMSSDARGRVSHISSLGPEFWDEVNC